MKNYKFLILLLSSISAIQAINGPAMRPGYWDNGTWKYFGWQNAWDNQRRAWIDEINRIPVERPKNTMPTVVDLDSLGEYTPNKKGSLQEPTIHLQSKNFNLVINNIGDCFYAELFATLPDGSQTILHSRVSNERTLIYDLSPLFKDRISTAVHMTLIARCCPGGRAADTYRFFHFNITDEPEKNVSAQ